MVVLFNHSYSKCPSLLEETITASDLIGLTLVSPCPAIALP